MFIRRGIFILEYSLFDEIFDLEREENEYLFVYFFFVFNAINFCFCIRRFCHKSNCVNDEKTHKKRSNFRSFYTGFLSEYAVSISAPFIVLCLSCTRDFHGFDGWQFVKLVDLFSTACTVKKKRKKKRNAAERWIDSFEIKSEV